MALTLRLATALFALTTLVSLPISPPAEAQQQRRLLIFENADFSGFDYRTLRTVPLDECRSACLGDAECKAFTYNRSAEWCFLKSDFGNLSAVNGAVAGRIAEGSLPPAGRPDIDLGFLPAGFEAEARRQARRIAATRAGGGFAELMSQGRAALDRADGRAARSAYAGAVGRDETRYGAWIGLARALLSIKPKDYSEQYALPEEATAALVTALPLAATAGDRAYGYRLLGTAMERRQLWRPAIEALKASLAISENEQARAEYTRLQDTHGFRMLDYSVDADAASPRACVQFSEDLDVRGTDYGDYVTLDGETAPAITAEMRQICIDGLEHGSRYRVKLREGLPSTVGEGLRKSVDLAVYVRDRSPSIRFTGANYVLPKTGAKGIPLVSVNTETVEVEIYRIGERALAETLRGGRFLSSLNSFTAGNIAEQSGRRIWKGEMPVASTLNKEVVTAFPVDEILNQPEPGVYVMTARPSRGGAEEWEDQATQWFVVTDLGLASISGEDGVHVFARSLASADPLAGVELRLIARNNELLGTATTDAAGHAGFAPGLARGTGAMAPALVVAALDSAGFAFLDLTRPAFDFADRGVEGRPAPGPLDVFMTPERGVYRPGETIHLLALLRDENAMTVDGVPLTFIVQRPDGVEYARHRSLSRDLGGHEWDIGLGDGVMTGTWTIRAHTDPKAEALAEIRVLVEDFVPERLDFTLEASRENIAIGESVDVTVDGDYLFGAPAAGLNLEGDLRISEVRDGLEGFADYRFGLADQDPASARTPLEALPQTDDAGVATFPVALSALPESTGRLQATVTMRMREPGGRAVARDLTLPVAGASPLIGIRPLFGEEVAEGGTAEFDVRGFSGEGAPTALGDARWELVKLDRRYQWYRLDGRWSYEPVTTTRRVADGRITLGPDAPSRIAVPVDWGRYRLEVVGGGSDAPATSVEFDAGWYVADAASETPDTLQISLDRTGYRPGETARLRLAPRHAGKALVTVVAGGVTEMKTIDVPETGTVVDLAVGDNWGAGAYVTAALYRPMDVDAGRNPARAIGVDWLAIDNSARTLGVSFDIPEIVRPSQSLTVPVALTGLAPGEAARVTVAAVDVGILNLTGYKAPEPETWYFGQRRLGAEFRDLYGQLIDGLQGTRGTIRSGGDSSGLSMNGAPETEKPVALFSGIVTVGPEGKADITLDLPPFNGTLRLMAVAWSANGVGHGARDLVVREPVVMTSSLPRFMAPGDTSRLRLDIHNLEGPAGEWNLEVRGAGPVGVGETGQGAIVLPENARLAAEITLAAEAAGNAIITARLTHASGMEIERAFDLKVRPAQPPISRRDLSTLTAAGDALTLSADLIAGFVPGSATVSLTVSRGLFADVPGLLASLDRYPYGCAEQTTSRALPLLYVNAIASEAGLATDAELKARIAGAIDRVLQYQGANGSFGLWSIGDGDLWLDAYITDFLSRARAAGHTVPGVSMTLALDNLENGLAYVNDINGGEGIAYALYVLARNARASLGDLRYYVDARLDDFTTPLGKAQLGGALALMGDRTRAAKALRAAFISLSEPSERHTSRSDFGSALRDGAALLTIAAEAGTDFPVGPVARFVEQRRAEAASTSTQENAWMLLAANGLMGADEGLELNVDGALHRGRLFREFGGESLLSAPVVVRNTGVGGARTVVTVTGVPTDPEPARADGLTLERRYYLMDGTPADPSTVAQNERLVVVLELAEDHEWMSRLVMSDLLPAGFEIENPRLVGGEEASGLSWIGEVDTPTHTEFRDDRFVAAFTKPAGSAATYRVAYIVRAVSTGRFVHPPAVAEDMYRAGIEARTAMGTVEVVGVRP